MIAIVTGLILLAGPFATLGIWLWLRSRRAPVRLAEPLDMGRVLGSSLTVFRPENWPVWVLAMVLIGLPRLVWEIVFQPKLQAQLLSQNQLLAQPGVSPVLRPNPFSVLANAYSPAVIAMMFAQFVIVVLFYVIAIQLLVGRLERRPIAFADALKASPLLALAAFAVVVISYIAFTLASMLFVLPGIVLALSWCVAIPVLVSERTGVFRCLGRSRELTIGSRGRILVVGLLMIAIAVALIAPQAMTTHMLGQTTGAIVIVMRVVFSTINGMLYAAYPAALYVELKRIREGLAMPDLADVFA